MMNVYFTHGRLIALGKLELRLPFLLRVRILALVMGLLRLLLRAGSFCNCLKYAQKVKGGQCAFVLPLVASRVCRIFSWPFHVCCMCSAG